jgi:putative phosphoribosyl transferase
MVNGTDIPARERAVQVPVDGIALNGALAVPEDARGLIIVVTGAVPGDAETALAATIASTLHAHGFATLLLDLLTPEERIAGGTVDGEQADVTLLAARLVIATVTKGNDADTHGLPIGYVGAGVSGAAALIAASVRPLEVRAVVSCSAQPEDVEHALTRLRVPTLLVAGSRDPATVAASREMLAELRGARRLSVVRGAGRTFDEPGAARRVAELAAEWLGRHVPAAAGTAPRSIEFW